MQAGYVNDLKDQHKQEERNRQLRNIIELKDQTQDDDVSFDGESEGQ